MVEVMKIMVLSVSVSHSALSDSVTPWTAAHQAPLSMRFWQPPSKGGALSVPSLQQAPANPRLQQRLLHTHGRVWVSLLWGPCSFLSGPGAQKFLFVCSKSVSAVLCKLWWLYAGVSGDLLQEGLPYPGLLHPEPLPLQQSTALLFLRRRHSNTVLTQSLWALWVLVGTRFVHWWPCGEESTSL